MQKSKTLSFLFIVLLIVNTYTQQPVHTDLNVVHKAQLQSVSSSLPNIPQHQTQSNPTVTSQSAIPGVPSPPQVDLQSQILIDNEIPAIPINPAQSQIQHEQVIQIQQQNKIHQQLNAQLPKWIRQQLQQMTSLIQLPITQTFTFIIPSGEEVIFKWDPSKEKQLKLIVDVFYVTREGAIQVIKDAEQVEYIEVSIKNPNKLVYTTIGQVYRNKILTVDFDTDYKFLKFTNKNSQQVIVQIDVEKLQYVVMKGVKDDKLSTSQNKISTILHQTESTQIKREHLYKWQWGYYQNQQSHQLRILGLTGIQLFVILVTACVQMYFLKSLLDNRAVV